MERVAGLHADDDASRMKTLVTGGAGFIGSALVRRLLAGEHSVVTVDKLTYAGHLASLGEALEHPRHRFERVDICDARGVRRILSDHAPDAILHLAAESHVDRSIDGPADFLQTNLTGTFTLLEESLAYWGRLDPSRQARFRFLHVSTDEVFGSLSPSEPEFTEASPYRPNSPYAATKAGADHLVRAWHRTHGLPVLVTYSSNNYGPRQFPEKLIPLTILRAIEGRPIGVYGSGTNRRDWLHVEDHVDGLLAALERGRVGEAYAFASGVERENLQLVQDLCSLIDELAPDRAAGPRKRLVRLVEDRPGHDHRYAIDARKAMRDLGWKPRIALAEGLRRTVEWYLENRDWLERVQGGVYGGERLGLGGRA
jgi:dTDP-glucose 4,6-dehydratase